MSLPNRILEHTLLLLGIRAEWVHLHARQGIKFGTVGLFNTFLDLALLAFFVEIAHVPLRFAVVSSGAIAITSSFLINKFWTFHNGSQAFGKQYILFVAVYLSSFGVGIATTLFCAEVLGIYYLLSRIIALPVTTAWNYLWLHFRVFR